jgi:SNF2 family DNA or RNA helicase
MNVLRHFQEAGRDWLRPRSRALLGDDPGLGKTIQALMAHPPRCPLMTVCPATAKGIWKRESLKWRPDLRPTILEGRGSFRIPQDDEHVILNYDILPETAPKLLTSTTVIGDEATAVKSNQTKRHERFKLLTYGALKTGGRAWALTGSPLMNHPYELWNILRSVRLEKEAFGSWPNFMWLFNGVQGRFGIQYGRPRPEVWDHLKKVMLRRTQEQVLDELPPTQIQDVPVDIPANVRAICDKAAAFLAAHGIDLTKPLEMADATKIYGADFDEVSHARKALAMAKIPAMLDFIEPYEESDEPLVVFSCHRVPIDLLSKRKGWAVITGDESSSKRTKAEDDFQAGRLKGIAATIQAGGTCITLTRSAHALFVDELWTPELNRQARMRLKRMTQKRSVTFHRLVADHAIDERVAEVNARKKDLVSLAIPDPIILPLTEFQEESHGFQADLFEETQHVQ